MSRRGVEPEYDPEFGIWEIGVPTPGPAGIARLVLSDGLEALVDVADPSQWGVVLTEDDLTGQVLDDDLAAAATLVGSAIVAPAAGGRPLPDEDAEQGALAVRLALGLDRLERARSDDHANLWAAELAELANRADPRLGLERALAPYRAAARDGRPELERLQSEGTGIRPRRGPDLELIEAARPRLTPGADGRSLVGTVVVDDALAPRRVLALDQPADLRWDRIDQTLRVECRVAPRAYLPEVANQWARAYRPDTRAMVAIGSLAPTEPGVASVDLLLGPLTDDAVQQLAVDVTPDPAARPPSISLRGADTAANFGRAAVTAERLGLADAAAEAWRRSQDAWTGIGDTARAEQAGSNADAAGPRTARAAAPFSAEVLAATR